MQRLQSEVSAREKERGSVTRASESIRGFYLLQDSGNRKNSVVR